MSAAHIPPRPRLSVVARAAAPEGTSLQDDLIAAVRDAESMRQYEANHHHRLAQREPVVSIRDAHVRTARIHAERAAHYRELARRLREGGR